jgi:NadR type nicotinamide-nucleotide adenylyltransferase
MILGKFLPPHLGHRYLIDFARHYCDELTVLVCTFEREPIDGERRFEWMQRMFPASSYPNCNIVHITDELPQTPDDHPDFWQIWRNLVLGAIPGGTDLVFASEEYGFRLADELGARYVPVDHDREVMPVSGSAVREDPMAHWEYIPVEVRPHYLKRVCIFGPESTGKSTLARDLAEHFDTAYVHEYARPLLDFKDGRCDYSDIELIARGQAAAEDALAPSANRVLFCDTDPLTTTLWSEVFFGKCPAWVTREAQRRNYDLYLLMDVDVGWVDDDQRYFPEQNARAKFFDQCQAALDARNRPYVRIHGSWAERFERAVAAVEQLLTALVAHKARPFRLVGRHREPGRPPPRSSPTHRRASPACALGHRCRPPGPELGARGRYTFHPRSGQIDAVRRRSADA